MNLDFDKLAPSKEMLSENESILAKFVADGIDLARVEEVEFVSDFGNEADARSCREVFKVYRANCMNVFGFSSCYNMLNSYPDEARFDLYFIGVMDVNTPSISRAECRLDHICKMFGGSRVTWGFEHPTPDPEMRLH